MSTILSFDENSGEKKKAGTWAPYPHSVKCSRMPQRKRRGFLCRSARSTHPSSQLGGRPIWALLIPSPYSHASRMHGVKQIVPRGEEPSLCALRKPPNVELRCGCARCPLPFARKSSTGEAPRQLRTLSPKSSHSLTSRGRLRSSRARARVLERRVPCVWLKLELASCW